MNNCVCNFGPYTIFRLAAVITQRRRYSSSSLCTSHLFKEYTQKKKYSFRDDFHIILLRIDYYSSIVPFHHISYHWKEKWTILFIYSFLWFLFVIFLFFRLRALLSKLHLYSVCFFFIWGFCIFLQFLKCAKI